MASFTGQLIAVANEIAFSYEGRAPQIERELAEIEAQKAKLQAELHTAHLAHERLSRFVPVFGPDLQSPRCWIDHETRSVLHGTGHGTRGVDTFRCHTCDLELALSVGGR